MKDCTITAKSSITRSLGPLILGNIYGPFMKVCDIHAISANISQLGGNILREHIRSIHKGICYLCNQCEYQATLTQYLRKHIQSIHEGFRHVCNQCDYKSTTNGSITEHLRSIHERVHKPCNECDYKR